MSGDPREQLHTADRALIATLRRWVVAVLVALLFGCVGGIIAFVLVNGLEFDRTFSVGDAANIFVFVVALLGVFFAVLQLREYCRTEKAQFFKDLYSEMFRDSDIRKAFYLVEYDQFVYDEAFRGTEEEKLVDRLLAFANLVCDLRHRGIFNDKEMGIVDYEFSRISKNEAVRRYLDFLEDWYKKEGRPDKPFQSFTSVYDVRGERPDTDAGKRPKWTSSLKDNLKQMLDEIKAAVDDLAFCDDVRAQIHPGDYGPLREKLTRLSDVGDVYPGAKFYGKLIGNIARALRGTRAKEVLQLLGPFFTWDYGTEALQCGLDMVGWEWTAKRLQHEPDNGLELVEAIWLIGLLSLWDERAGTKHSATATGRLWAIGEWGYLVDSSNREGVRCVRHGGLPPDVA